MQRGQKGEWDVVLGRSMIMENRFSLAIYSQGIISILCINKVGIDPALEVGRRVFLGNVFEERLRDHSVRDNSSLADTAHTLRLYVSCTALSLCSAHFL